MYIPVRVCDRSSRGYRVIVIQTTGGYAFVIRTTAGDRQGGSFASADVALTAGLCEAALLR